MKHHLKHLLSLALVAVLGLAPVSRLRATDLAITASAVVPSGNARIASAPCGATIAAGQLIYLDSTDTDAQGRGKAKLADCNSGTAAVRAVAGMAISSASAGSEIAYVWHDPALVIAASGLTANTVYILSATAGGVAPFADLTTGWYLSVIAVVKNGTTIYFSAPGLFSGAAS